MSALLSTTVAAAAVVFGALVGRRELEHRVASRQVGAAIELPTMHAVLDLGDRLWRGPAPTPVGYQELGAAGCSLIVDLRAEADLDRAASLASAAGMDLLVLATDNSRAPGKDHLEQFVAALDSTAGSTYVHCEAGEGRTGAIIGAYQVRNGVSSRQAIADALAIGSLTFSQLSYIAMSARAPIITKVLDLGLDRPTEAVFDLLRERRTS